MTDIAAFMLPAVMVAAGLLFAFSKKDLFPLFISGCSDGLKTTASLLPTLIMLIVGVKMFSASGALSALCTVLSPLCRELGIPEELLPVAVMRPISGSGATAMIKELFDTAGPDGVAGRAASVMMGSSDTILYTLSVYFAHTRTKKTGYAMFASFAVMLFCLAVSSFLAGKF